MRVHHGHARDRRWGGQQLTSRECTASDTLLVQVHQEGVACHTGARSCFFNALQGGGPDGKRPCFGYYKKFQEDPHWNQCLLFNEYYHGDTGMGLGASHQTGWSGLVANLIDEWRR